jgi:cyclopropane-fatty-acyl-phospholipid synthase
LRSVTLANERRPRSPRRLFGLERRTAQNFVRALGSPPVSIITWDGDEIAGSPQPPAVRVRVHDRATLWRLMLDPLLHFGEGYTSGAIEVEGSLVDLLRMVHEATRPIPGPVRHARSVPHWRGERAVTLAGSRSNAAYHYDLGNEFYKLWLDDQLCYTCAYFERPDCTLEQAQVAKFDHICRKLRLQPGETVIEAGCGWGGLALHMARRYGVTVRAYNVSREQLAYARERARAENLDHAVQFVEADWRLINGHCDAFVSVGMLEHVGVGNYPELGEVIHRALAGRGRGLIHSIGRNFPEQLNSWIRHRIFPEAEPPSLSQMMDVFESRDFSVLDVENLRLHYAVTLKNWLERFEEHAAEVEEQFGREFVRMWRLYLASSMVAFECGSLQLFQVVFNSGRCNDGPWTRDHQYGSAGEQAQGDAWRLLRAKDGRRLEE